MENDKDYINRKLISEIPNFKLNAYCINLKEKIINMEFINNEWKDFLNITRFEALDSCTKSHIELLKKIWNNKKNETFPIVIMEDDVFRRGNFTKYWNKIKQINECDYITLDGFFFEFNQDKKYSDFLGIKKHNTTGFIIYNKYFFDRFDTEELINLIGSGIIDLDFTHNKDIIKYTPKEQICRQVVSKISSTANYNTENYLEYYELAEKELKYNI
tara:strand:+ start:2735 stop:3382 length:648 start_codon:yes stop_codon:yes gene_type:complete